MSFVAAVNSKYYIITCFPLQLVLPDRRIPVYPDDVVAVQHTRRAGTFLHCPAPEPSSSSPWRQSYLSLGGSQGGGGGWWEGGLSSPDLGGRWVDGVVCNLRMLYVDALPGKSRALPNTEAPPPRGAEDRPADAGMTSDPEGVSLSPGRTPPPSRITGLEVIHPRPDAENQLHLQVMVPVLGVVRIRSGGPRASSSWSAPGLQTGGPFGPSCPDEVTAPWLGCERESPDTWFSSVTLTLPSVGVHALEVSAVNSVSSQTVSVRLWGYEAVTGLSVEPPGHRRVLTGSAQVRMSVRYLHQPPLFHWEQSSEE